MKKNRHNYVEKRHLNRTMRKCYIYFFTLPNSHSVHNARAHAHVHEKLQFEQIVSIRFAQPTIQTVHKIQTFYTLHIDYEQESPATSDGRPSARSLEPLIQSF